MFLYIQDFVTQTSFPWNWAQKEEVVSSSPLVATPWKQAFHHMGSWSMCYSTKTNVGELFWDFIPHQLRGNYAVIYSYVRVCAHTEAYTHTDTYVQTDSGT